MTKPFHGNQHFFLSMTLTLESGLLFENSSLVNNILILSARALIFNMNILCDKIFLLSLNLLTLTFDQFFEN